MTERDKPYALTSNIAFVCSFDGTFLAVFKLRLIPHPDTLG